MMPAISVVTVASLENSLDCSADYYRPDYLVLSNQLRAQPFSKIRSIGYVTDGEHGSPDWDAQSGIRYIAAEHVLANAISDAPMRTVSAAQDARNARCRVQANDILVYSVGAYAGLAARAEPHTFPATIPRSVAIIRLKAGAPFRPGFVSAFLNTQFGQFQTRRLRAGNSQPVLALEKIRQIELPHVPLESQDEVDQLYENAYLARQAGRASRALARDLLDAELGLDTFSYQPPMGYATSYSDVEASRRFDPENYFPAFGAFRNRLASGKSLSPLSNHLTFCQRGTQPIYAKTGLQVVNSKHVQTNRAITDNNRLAHANPDANLQIRFGDILLNGTGRGTIGRAAPYLNPNVAVPDNHVTILRSTSLDPAYLSLYLNSAAGQMQVEMHQRGSSGQLELYPLDIRKFLVWVAPKDFQQEIRRLHDTAAAAERKSHGLLAQAKSRVEQLIEEAVQS